MNRFVTRLWMLAMVLSVVTAQGEEEGVVQIRTQPLQRQVMSFTVTGYGTVTSTPRNTQSIALPRAGMVDQVRVTPGQRVAQGEPLFEFVTDPTSVVGHTQAQTTWDFAHNEYARLQRQYEQQLVTVSQLEAARKALRDAESALQAQDRLGAGSERVTVGAPFEGVILTQSVAQGEHIPAGTTILQLARRAQPQVQLTLPVEEAGQVREGMPVTLTPLFGPPQSWHGTVVALQGMINAQTQGVDLWVRLDPGVDPVLGMKVRATLEVRTQTLWTVPRSAVLRDEAGEAYLFQVQEGHAHRVAVTAFENGTMTGVEGALNPTLPVVVEGNYELADGMAVRGTGR
ncbi:p-hydroxybenzoic acid efflux pump subunit AaeA [mine drainage metagenome]|uniref:p-hydroxybenzoic acid efflux pump subunit AaeA n=1 Tax=mine drainage metagenome TaxID=410659 RepID=A0A3P3ZL64_9ZZZZ